MQSSESEVAKRLITGLRRMGFFVFGVNEYHYVSRLLSNAGLHHVLRVKTLDPARKIFIVDIDHRVYRPQCRERCLVNNILDAKCYSTCIEESRLTLLKDALRKLESLVEKSGAH